MLVISIPIRSILGKRSDTTRPRRIHARRGRVSRLRFAYLLDAQPLRRSSRRRSRLLDSCSAKPPLMCLSSARRERHATHKSVDQQVAIQQRRPQDGRRSAGAGGTQPASLPAGARTEPRGAGRPGRRPPDVHGRSRARRTKSDTQVRREDRRPPRGRSTFLAVPWPAHSSLGSTESEQGAFGSASDSPAPPRRRVC